MKYLLYFPLLFLLGNNFFLVQERTKKPIIEFKATTVSFDTVKAGTITKGEFTFKNTGDEPLIISTVQAADGGTMAFWPKEPVKPGTEDVIKVQLNTAGRNGFQDKLFTVISNTENEIITLHWKGYIVRSE